MNRDRFSVFLRVFRTNAIVIALVFLLLYLLAFAFLRFNVENNAASQQDTLLTYAADLIENTDRSLEASVDMVFGDFFTLNDLCAYMNKTTLDYSGWRAQNLSLQSGSKYRGKEGFIGENFQNNTAMSYLLLYGFSNYTLRVYDQHFARGPIDQRKLPRLDDNVFLEYQKLTTLFDHRVTGASPCAGRSFLLNNTLAAEDATVMAMFFYDLETPISNAFRRYGSFDGYVAIKQNGYYKIFSYDVHTGEVNYSALAEDEYLARYGSGYKIESRAAGNATEIISALRSASVERESLTQGLVLFLVILVLVFCALLSIWVSMSKSQRRMALLLESIDHVKQGDLSVRIDVGREKDDLQLISQQFNQMCEQLTAYIRRTYEAQLQTKNAQLVALESQINPHFLYNTLEIIRIKAAESNDSQVEKMIYCLVTLYRSIVKDETFITIEKEVEYAQSFIHLLQLAYEDTEIDVCVDVEPELLQCHTIKFILQPIIENFFVHGVNRGESGNTLLLLVYEDDGGIAIRVENIGNPIAPQMLDDINAMLGSKEYLTSRKYIGICNVHQRIRNVYGSPYGVRMERSEDGMPVYLLRLPQTEDAACRQDNQPEDAMHGSLPGSY